MSERRQKAFNDQPIASTTPSGVISSDTTGTMATPESHPRQKYIVFAAAAALRLLLVVLFPRLPDFLSNRVEISTPVTAFKRLKEGLFLYSHGVSPYDGGVFHQAPLHLALFSLFPSVTQSALGSVLIYTLLDLISANSLISIADSRLAHLTPAFRSPRSQQGWHSLIIALSYLFNPLVILTCLGRPTSVFSTTFVLLATEKACLGEMQSSAFALALAMYNSMHPALLLPPLAMLCSQGHKSNERRSRANPTTSSTGPSFFLRYSITFAAGVALLMGLSYLLVQDWSFIPAVYGTRLLLPDLTPNVGLWWYFFIEMFDSFRSFFVGVFWLHLASYSPGLTIRLRHQPLAAITLLSGIFAIFQPYANVGDVGAWMSMLTLYSHVFGLTRYSFPALSTLLYSTLLGPAFYYLWLYAGSGNANFFYAITLVWSLGCVVILADVLYAVLRDEWEVERPDMKGKEARQI